MLYCICTHSSSSSYSQRYALIFEVNKCSKSKHVIRSRICVLRSKLLWHHICIWQGSRHSRVMKRSGFEPENHSICTVMECEKVTTPAARGKGTSTRVALKIRKVKPDTHLFQQQEEKNKRKAVKHTLCLCAWGSCQGTHLELAVSC